MLWSDKAEGGATCDLLVVSPLTAYETPAGKATNGNHVMRDAAIVIIAS